MLVLCLSNCPPSLRGDLTRWLQEIDTGVYAGTVSARVREELWTRVTKNIGDGRATMVYSARTEQHMEFRVHNTPWMPIDFDGMKLMLRPNAEHLRAAKTANARHGYSTAAKAQAAKKFGNRVKAGMRYPQDYVAIDIETTGLSVHQDCILEIGAVRVEKNEIADELQRMIRAERSVPPTITELTGITDDMLMETGVDERTALAALQGFIGQSPMLMYNMSFDLSFLNVAYQRNGLPPLSNAVTDAKLIVKETIDDVDNYRLSTVAEYFGIQPACAHRSIADCKTMIEVYTKLMDFSQASR